MAKGSNTATSVRQRLLKLSREQGRVFDVVLVTYGLERLIIATGRYIGEGFDDARLDTLFLTMPTSWRGTLQQYVGHLHRQHGAKHEVRVYDGVDQNVPVLRRMYERRPKGYQAMGYKVASDERGS